VSTSESPLGNTALSPLRHWRRRNTATAALTSYEDDFIEQMSNESSKKISGFSPGPGKTI